MLRSAWLKSEKGRFYLIRKLTTIVKIQALQAAHLLRHWKANDRTTREPKRSKPFAILAQIVHTFIGDVETVSKIEVCKRGKRLGKCGSIEGGTSNNPTLRQRSSS